MDDVRLGALYRAARLRRRWRQVDVSGRAGVTPRRVSEIERGQLDGVRVDELRRVARVLEVDLDLRTRWRGGEGERLLSARHSALAEAFTKVLVADGWDVRPEVSFSIWGERGVIDILAWHPATRTLLVVEIKTELVDVGEMLGTLDRKRRLAPFVARDLGIDPASIAACVILLEAPTNHRHLASHAATIRAALPADGRRLRAWLRHPDGPLAALMFLSIPPVGTARSEAGGLRRVRLRQTATDSPQPRTASASAGATGQVDGAKSGPGHPAVRSRRPGEPK